MPTYQYACTACGHRFEAVQSFSDSSLTDCPECAGRLRKVFSSVGIVFKGSGFYRTDSRVGRIRHGLRQGLGKEKVAAGSSTSSDSGDSKGSSCSDSSTKKADSSSTSTSSSALVVDQQRARGGCLRLTRTARARHGRDLLRPGRRPRRDHLPPAGLRAVPVYPMPISAPAAATSGRRSCPHCGPAVHRFA